jgi:hypothetical protein
MKKMLFMGLTNLTVRYYSIRINNPGSFGERARSRSSLNGSCFFLESPL